MEEHKVRVKYCINKKDGSGGNPALLGVLTQRRGKTSLKNIQILALPHRL